MGWAVLSVLYGQAIMLGLDTPGDAVLRQMRAADRAVALDSKNQPAWSAMATKATLARDLAALREASERCVSINPLSGHVTGCAIYLALAGDDERALEIYQRCQPLLSQRQDWYHVVPMLRENRAANLPMTPLYHLGGAALAGHAGDVAVVKGSLDGLRKIAPALLEPENARAFWAVWIWSHEHLDVLEAGFRKANALVSGLPSHPPGGDTDPPARS